MPGLNLTGLSDANNYVLGRGVVYFSSVDANGFPKEFRDLGNCSAFAVSQEVETLEHQSSRAGLKTVDKKVTVSRTMSISFTLDEINIDNLALWASGGTSATAQAGGSVTHTNNQGNVRVSGKARWYDIYDNVTATTGFAYPPPNTAKRVYSLSGVTVKNMAGGTTYLLGTDYTLDLTWGRIFITAGSNIGATDEISVAYTKAAKSVEQASALTVSEVSGALKFIQVNAAKTGDEVEVQFHGVTLTADGDLSLLGEEFQSMNFSGSVEAREAVDPAAPLMRARYVR